MSEKEEEEFVRVATELRILEETSNELQLRIGILEAALSDLKASEEALKGLMKEKEGSEILAPIGGGSYIKAFLADVKSVIVGMGAGISMEKKTEEALQIVRDRIAEVDKGRVNLQQQLLEVLMEIEARRRRLAELSEKLRKRKAS